MKNGYLPHFRRANVLTYALATAITIHLVMLSVA